VNDLDCYIANFWRALAAAPDEVARFADWPVNEIDLHARHAWLIEQAAFRERMRADPTYCDTRVAGWWVWGISTWIGSNWCRQTQQSIPHLSNPGHGDSQQERRRVGPHAGVGRAVTPRPRGVR
jgi:hypothetical protein